jgi:hypothetical protein
MLRIDKNWRQQSDFFKFSLPRVGKLHLAKKFFVESQSVGSW